MKREWKQRKNSISTLKSVRVRLRESVRLQERENTESNWEAQTGKEEKNLESCPLTRVFVSGEFTVKITFNTYQFLNAFQRR